MFLFTTTLHPFQVRFLLFNFLNIKPPRSLVASTLIALFSKFLFVARGRSYSLHIPFLNECIQFRFFLLIFYPPYVQPAKTFIQKHALANLGGGTGCGKGTVTHEPCDLSRHLSLTTVATPGQKS